MVNKARNVQIVQETIHNTLWAEPKGGKRDSIGVDKAAAVADKKDKLTCISASLGFMVVSMCIAPLQIRHPRKKRL